MQYIEKRNTFLSKNLLHQNHRRSTRPEECAIYDFHFSFMGHLFRFKWRKAPQYKIKLCVDNSYPNGGDGARVSLGSVFLENIVALRPLVPLWHFPQLYRFIWKSKAVSDQRLNGVAKRKGNGKSLSRRTLGLCTDRLWTGGNALDSFSWAIGSCWSSPLSRGSSGSRTRARGSVGVHNSWYNSP